MGRAAFGSVLCLESFLTAVLSNESGAPRGKAARSPLQATREQRLTRRIAARLRPGKLSRPGARGDASSRPARHRPVAGAIARRAPSVVVDTSARARRPRATSSTGRERRLARQLGRSGKIRVISPRARFSTLSLPSRRHQHRSAPPRGLNVGTCHAGSDTPGPCRRRPSGWRRQCSPSPAAGTRASSTAASK